LSDVRALGVPLSAVRSGLEYLALDAAPRRDAHTVGPRPTRAHRGTLGRARAPTAGL